jgi:hypothetical protein
LEDVFDTKQASNLRKQATESGIVIHGSTFKAVLTQSVKNRSIYIRLRQMPLYPSEKVIV